MVEQKDTNRELAELAEEALRRKRLLEARIKQLVKEVDLHYG
jgi:hypothetical protein